MSEESQISLHFDVLCNIMFSGLKTSDVLHCMQVCKSWKVNTLMITIRISKVI